MSEPCALPDPAAASRMPVPNLCAYCCAQFAAAGYGLQAQYEDEDGIHADMLKSLMGARQAWARGHRILSVHNTEVGLYPDTQITGSLVCAQHAAAALDDLAGRNR